MGRFFQATPVEYIDDAMYENPVDLMASALATKDKEFNSAIEGAESALDFELNPHAKDTEEAQRIRAEYEEKVDAITKEAYEDKLNTGKLKQKISAVQRDMLGSKRDGDIYNINARNSEILETKKSLLEQYQKDPDKFSQFNSAAEISAYVDENYSGYKNEAGEYTTSPSVALQKKEQDLDILKNLFKEHTGMDMHSKTDKDIGLMMQTKEWKSKGLSGEELKETIKNYLQGNKGIRNYLQQKADVKNKVRGIETDIQKEYEEYANDLYTLGQDLYQERITMSSKTFKSLPKDVSDRKTEQRENFTTVKKGQEIQENVFASVLSSDRGTQFPYRSNDAQSKLQTFISEQQKPFLELTKNSIQSFARDREVENIDYHSGTVEIDGQVEEVDEIVMNSIAENVSGIDAKQEMKAYQQNKAKYKILEDTANSYMQMERAGVNLNSIAGKRLVVKSKEFVEDPGGIYASDPKQGEAMRDGIYEALDNEATKGAARIQTLDLQGKLKGKSGKPIVFKRPGESDQELSERLGVETQQSSGMGPQQDNSINAKYEVVEIDSPNGYITVNALQGMLAPQTTASVKNKTVVKRGVSQSLDVDSQINQQDIVQETEGVNIEFGEKILFPRGFPKEGNDLPVQVALKHGRESITVTLDAYSTGVSEKVSEHIEEQRDKSFVYNTLDNMAPNGEAVNSKGEVTFLHLDEADDNYIYIDDEEIPIYTRDKKLYVGGKEVKNRETAYEYLNYFYNQ